MKKTIPKNRYRIHGEVNPTRYIMTEEGLMDGRELVAYPRSDNTRIMRMNRDFDIDGDKKPDFKKGQIIARISGQNPKKVLVEQHKRKGKVIRRHLRFIK